MSDTSFYDKLNFVEFIETRPLVLLGVIAILTLTIIVMYVNMRYDKIASKKMKSDPKTDEEEIDSLIETISKEQKESTDTTFQPEKNI